MTRQPYRKLSLFQRRVQSARCWVRANWLYCAVLTANAAWLYTVMVGVGR